MIRKLLNAYFEIFQRDDTNESIGAILLFLGFITSIAGLVSQQVPGAVIGLIMAIAGLQFHPASADCSAQSTNCRT